LTCVFEVTLARFKPPWTKIRTPDLGSYADFRVKKNEESAEPWRISRVMDL